MTNKEELDLTKEYVLLDVAGNHARWEADEFWKAAFREGHPAFHKDMGYLVSRYAFSGNWTSWERHPLGDELVYVTKGRMIFLLEGKGETLLVGGDAFVIPKGVWHTARVPEPSEALFMTFGFGTEHRAIEP